MRKLKNNELQRISVEDFKSAKKTPIIICRKIGDNTEYWKIEDFINI